MRATARGPTDGRKLHVLSPSKDRCRAGLSHQSPRFVRSVWALPQLALELPDCVTRKVKAQALRSTQVEAIVFHLIAGDRLIAYRADVAISITCIYVNMGLGRQATIIDEAPHTETKSILYRGRVSRHNRSKIRLSRGEHDPLQLMN